MIETEIIIVGAGPVGLFTVFEAGLLKMRCHVVDSLPSAGGQLSEIYPKKPIYDIPGYPMILAGQLVKNLLEQIAPFNPGFTLGETVVSLEYKNSKYQLVTNRGTELMAPVVIIAGGLGVFQPRKPPINNLVNFEDRGVEYIIRDPEFYKGKKVVISGGGDSALDWTVFLVENKIPTEISLVHRRSIFRGQPDSVQKVMEMASQGKINLLTESEVVEIIPDSTGRVKSVVINHDTSGKKTVDTDHFIPLFGLTPSLGPIADWGLEIEKNAIVVNTVDYSTKKRGIFAVGDINTYPGKLKLILCGFHEGTLAVQSAFAIIHPDKRNVLKYTTVNGVNPF